jgi:hypothetical protein
MNRRAIATLSVALVGLGWAGLASGQSAAPATRYYYQPAQPRYVQRPAAIAPRRAAHANPSLPFTRSPYTDDWSTGRHLPYPKPWMLPTREAPYRGR